MSVLIETVRLRLSPYHADDADALVDNAGRPEVARMLESIPLPFKRGDALDRIARRVCDAKRFTLAIRHKESGRMIGEIAAGSVERDGTPCLGYHLHPDFWGQGIISEAIPAALDHAFRTLSWPIVDADVFDDNPASIKVLEKAGFAPVGVSECQSSARDSDAAGTRYRLYRARWIAPVIRTARLTLRAPRMADAPRVAPLIGDYEVAKMLTPVPYPYTLSDAEEWLSGSMGKPDDITLAVDLDGDLIGVASLTQYEDDIKRLGFWLGRPYWRHGYMSEAVAALVGWGFRENGLREITSEAFEENIGSRRIHSALGFVEHDRHMAYSVARGEDVPACYLSLSREDWTRRQ